MASSCRAACHEKCARWLAARPLSATQWSSQARPASWRPVSYMTCVCACTACPDVGSHSSAVSASSPASSKRDWSCRVNASSEMYHQWSPYAGARPSTSSHASCWMSVTPEKAIVGTAAETASTSRGCCATWFISAVAPELRTSSTRRPTTSTRLRSRSSARAAGGHAEPTPTTHARRPRTRPRDRASPARRAPRRSRGRASQPRAASRLPPTAAASGARARRCTPRRPRPWSTAAARADRAACATG